VRALSASSAKATLVGAVLQKDYAGVELLLTAKMNIAGIKGVAEPEDSARASAAAAPAQWRNGVPIAPRLTAAGEVEVAERGFAPPAAAGGGAAGGGGGGAAGGAQWSSTEQ